MDTASLIQSRKASQRGAINRCSCDYTGPQWADAKRCAHCGGLLSHALDTGNWHGPVEGFIVSVGVLAGEGIESTYNGARTFGTFRVEDRATANRDWQTLYALADEAEAAGASGHALHLRRMAAIYAPVVYYRPDDMMCALVRQDDDALTVEHPMIGTVTVNASDCIILGD